MQSGNSVLIQPGFSNHWKYWYWIVIWSVAKIFTKGHVESVNDLANTGLGIRVAGYKKSHLYLRILFPGGSFPKTCSYPSIFRSSICRPSLGFWIGNEVKSESSAIKKPWDFSTHMKNHSFQSRPPSLKNGPFVVASCSWMQCFLETIFRPVPFYVYNVGLSWFN